MYSVVLMMALSAPAETPMWGARAGCTGCTGAGSCHGGLGWFGFLRFNCNGCCGGAGPAFGVHGGGSVTANLGASPLTYYGFAGCYGSCYGSYTNYFSYWSTPVSSHYGYGMPRKPGAAPTPPPPPGTDKAAAAPAPATVIVRLPADATLFANGVRTGQANAERRFVTPELSANEMFHYELKVEAIRNGQTVTETRMVEVWANATVNVDFGDLATAKAKVDLDTAVADGK
jgi:uncharacterized protein (TIGR03000 family)